MDGIQATGTATSAQIQTQYQARVMVMQKDAVQFQGEQALQLIQAATIDPDVGATVNIQV